MYNIMVGNGLIAYYSSLQYVSNTLALIAGSDLQNADLLTIMKHAAVTKNQNLFNNAGQSYNHEFYWNSMKPAGGGLPSGLIADLINRDFGSFDGFKADFIKTGLAVFGSGW